MANFYTRVLGLLVSNVQETEALCRNRPGFISRAEWQKVQVDRLAVAN